MHVQRAEVTSKGNLVGELEWLVAKEDDLVFGQRDVQLLHVARAQRLAEIDPTDFRADVRRHLVDRDLVALHVNRHSVLVRGYRSGSPPSWLTATQPTFAASHRMITTLRSVSPR